MQISEQTCIHVQRTISHVNSTALALGCIVIGCIFTIPQRCPFVYCKNTIGGSHVDQSAILILLYLNASFTTAIQNNVS